MHLPDVSEFQPNIDWSSIVPVNGGSAIIRAMYGSAHTDTAWLGGRRAAARAAGVQALGIYQYIRGDQEITSQAHALAQVVGSLSYGEFLIGDLEEGSGNQLARANAWLATVNNQVPSYPGYSGAWLYSGESFVTEHGLEPIFDGSAVHTWIAAYRFTEPTIGHSLWQHSNGVIATCAFLPWPGGAGSCDCSSRNGTTADILALVTGGKSHQNTPVEVNDMESLTTGYGTQRIYKFIGGSAAGIALGCNAGEVGLSAPWVKVAISLPDGTWSRSRVRIPADTSVQDGRISIDFPNGGSGVSMVSVIRDSNGAADNVQVGASLY